ncbi:Uncharacterised protein [Mycobacteroides abscessus subsp. abscessus]|nr:Uncharacterised protein [Mycobacteroides abscessus subsp. abscessus]
MKCHHRVFRVVVSGERQRIPVPAVDVRGQRHPVIGGIGFLTQNRHLPPIGGIALTQHLDKSVTDHSMADDDDFLVHGFHTATSFLELEIAGTDTVMGRRTYAYQVTAAQMT